LYRWSFPDFAVHSSSPGLRVPRSRPEPPDLQSRLLYTLRNPSILRVAASCRVASFPIPAANALPDCKHRSDSQAGWHPVNGALGIGGSAHRSATVILMTSISARHRGVEALKILRVDRPRRTSPWCAQCERNAPRHREGLQERVCISVAGRAWRHRLIALQARSDEGVSISMCCGTTADHHGIRLVVSSPSGGSSSEGNLMKSGCAVCL